MCVDQLEQLGVDGRPDRPAGRLAAAGERIELLVPGRVVGLDHRVDRHLDLQVELLADAGVDDPARASRPDEEARDLLERLLGGRQPDPLDIVARGVSQPFERESQVRAALGGRHRVDLVDDARLSAGEQLLRAAGQHQVERLGGGDQDVGRLAEHRLPLALGRVAGAHGDLEVGADPAQRDAEVAVDVVGERLQRGHVHEADTVPATVPALRATVPGRGGPLLTPGWLAGQLVDRPQERGQRLARPGRGRYQDVLARRDRRPRLGLRRRRLGERSGEPLARAGSEVLEGHSVERSDPHTRIPAL